MNSKELYYLGLDLGSSFTKFVLIDNNDNVAHIDTIPTLSRRREEFEATMQKIKTEFQIDRTCSTGYGRKTVESDLKKTELVCASVGLSSIYKSHKVILDIGGEDIKIIESDANGGVINFFMNDKCSSGTGTFITEIAERAELETEEMSELAKNSKSARIMNSFCTVFAKSEILGWKFDGTSIEDMARGIYLSIVDRILKLPIKAGIPVYLCGGVIAHHPYLGELLSEAIGSKVEIVEHPQHAVALGAALLAKGSLI